MVHWSIVPSNLPRLIAWLLLFAVACTGPSSGSPDGPTRATLSPQPTTSLLAEDDPMAQVACGLPRKWLIRTARGYRPDRSAELAIIPKPFNWVSSGLPHVGPFDWPSEVPMFWYGPGLIRPRGVVDRVATNADIAPTWAAILGFDGFEAPDGEPLTDVLASAEERPGPPRLVLTVVWDGAGRNLLARWPEAWPNLRALRSEGAWIDRAEAGSSPTSSAQIHATIGTGAFPRHHGLVGHSMRIDGKIVSPWGRGPALLEVPTLADAYDRAMDGEPLVAMLGTVSIQLGLIGHGSALEGGDRDLVVLREPPDAETLGAEGERWNLKAPFDRWFDFPGYVNDLPPLSAYLEEIDRRDGRVDGAWLGHPFDDEQFQGGFQTPARIPYQTRLIEEVVAREGLGADDVTDLLFINYKVIDQIGHLFSIDSEEMRDTLKTQDAALPQLIGLLDRIVGRGRWAMVVVADHGSAPSPQVTGGFQISAAGLDAAIQDEFDRDEDDVDVVDQVKQTEIFINRAELEEHGGTLADVARFVMDLRQEQLVIEDVSIVSDPGGRVFRAAFPSEIIPRLPCLPEHLRRPPDGA